MPPGAWFDWICAVVLGGTGAVQGVKIGNVFLKKLGSGSVVQKFRYPFVCRVFWPLSSRLGPRGQGLKGFRQGWSFICLGGGNGGVKSEKLEK